MSVTLPRSLKWACSLCATVLAPSLSYSLGLGDIHLHSALNEPLDAQIDLISATPDEITGLRASLANREAFTRYGIDRPPFLSSFTFKVGKSKDGHDVLQVHSNDAIPEPFVTFLVDVNWSHGHLMREYTVLLDPPVYTPGESASSAAPVMAASAAPARAAAPAAATAAPAAPKSSAAAVAPAPTEPKSAAARGGVYRVSPGDTLSKIARAMSAGAAPAAVDQTMIALYRTNPDAFGGNINVLKRGAVLRVPDADAIAALNQKQATAEVERQMQAWRGGEAAASGHLRLVTPGAGGGATAPAGSAGEGGGAGLRDRIKQLEGELAESKRLLELRNNELAELQRKLGKPVTAPPASKAAVAAPPAAAPPAAASPAAATKTPAATEAASSPAAATPAATPKPAPAKPVQKPKAKPAAPAPASGSLIDWLSDNWWAPGGVVVLGVGALAFAAMRRRKAGEDQDFGARLEDTDVAGFPEAPVKASGGRKSAADSFVVEESGEHPMPGFAAAAQRLTEDTAEVRSPDDTMSSESAVNLDQGDPLAEADFHMAYGLYDQAADLVRIALEREPDRRDLRLKLLEIYFVWGNKDAFLQTAKSLAETRDRAPAGEWDKIVIMGKQICPEEPLFAAASGGGRGAGALVDLNLEGGENHVDIDLYGEPSGERSPLEHTLASEPEDTAATGESPLLRTGTGLDFMLDAPERGADESPTREMPARDEPTVESEMMQFADAPTQESPVLKPGAPRDLLASRLEAGKAEQTAELSIDDLGLDLDQLERTGSVGASNSHLAATGSHLVDSGSHLEETDHPADAPTMVAGLDERSQRLMAQAALAAGGLGASAASHSGDERDLTELERELEASFIAELDPHHDDVKTAVLGPESAPTVLMPRDGAGHAAAERHDMAEPHDLAARHDAVELSDVHEPELGVASTANVKALSGDSIDLDLDRLASAFGGGDTVQQARSDEDMFSSEVFEASQRNRRVDLDLGDAVEAGNGADHQTMRIEASAETSRLKALEGEVAELEPVTMSEVGTKLDLARAYMDMGDPEGARSILEEVVQEGSASQKQEAARLIESLPG